MEDSLTCCLGTPWWAAGRCQHPGPHCWHCPHLKFLSPETRCLPSASHFPQYEAGNCTRTAKEYKKISIQFVTHTNVNVCKDVFSAFLCMHVFVCPLLCFYLTAKTLLRSSMTLLSLTCRSFRISLASTHSWSTYRETVEWLSRGVEKQ